MNGSWMQLPDRTRAWCARPPKGSGPGVLLMHGGDATALASFADLLGEEGYTVLLPESADPGAALTALRTLPTFKGRIAAVGFGAGGAAAQALAADARVDCAVSYDPRDRMAYSRALAVLRRELGPYYDLSALWEAHRRCEFEARDADATMATMVGQPYVNHVPTLTGGYGQAELRRFYKHHFIPGNPKDMRNIPVSRTVGADRIVNEGVLCFTHDCEIDWLLPGVAPTGRYVEVGLVGIVTFRGDKLVHEHIYWDQASVLVQIGLLDPTGLPVAGIEAAKKILDPSRPANALMKRWAESDGK
jgi:hypothetical protein